MSSLPIRLSKKYHVKQVSTEVGKQHQSKSTYNNPNIQIKIIIPYIYLVNHLFLLIYPQTTRMANMMMTIMCTGMLNICY